MSPAFGAVRSAVQKYRVGVADAAADLASNGARTSTLFAKD
jgi:hypothetical protein